jgi:hypothetical protein
LKADRYALPDGGVPALAIEIPTIVVVVAGRLVDG